MLRIKIFFGMLLAAFAVNSCIEPYSPLLGEDDTVKYVVFGQLTDREGFQQVSVSKTTPVGSPNFNPVTGCMVRIIDDHGNTFAAGESGDGLYQAWMSGDDLTPGVAYRVEVITPDGDSLASAFDRMPPCPDFDTVYYAIEEVTTSDPERPMTGIRFYIDVDATGLDCHAFRWEVEETWEYRMDYSRQYYYDGTIHKIDPPDSSTRVCWITQELSSIYDVSTLNLGENNYRKYPLHFIDNRSSKLVVMYSMLIRQYSLSEEAYLFWDQLRINSSTEGGLYEHQPLSIRGNIKDKRFPEREVLGYFGASSVKQRRYFVRQVEGLEMDFAGFCVGPVPLGILGWSQFYPNDYPVYFLYDSGEIKTLEETCIDCRLQGGTTTKPEFWPQ